MEVLNSNKMTLVHIGAECLVIGGVVFYFQSKISRMNAELEALKKKVNEQDEVLQKYMTLLHQHEMVLRQIFDGGKVPLPPQPVQMQTQVPMHASVPCNIPPPPSGGSNGGSVAGSGVPTRSAQAPPQAPSQVPPHIQIPPYVPQHTAQGVAHTATAVQSQPPLRQQPYRKSPPPKETISLQDLDNTINQAEQKLVNEKDKVPVQEIASATRIANASSSQSNEECDLNTVASTLLSALALNEVSPRSPHTATFILTENLSTSSTPTTVIEDLDE